MDILDLEQSESRRIYSNIPEDLRTDDFRYKQNENDKYSILELISLNVKNIITQRKIEESLEKIRIKNSEAFEIILLTAYLIYHRSALTTDVLIGYFSITDVVKIQRKINVVRTYLS